MTELRNRQLYNELLALSVLRVLACIATALAVVGLFSVLAYTVDRRMPEFGIRMALGATPGDLVALVMRRGIALTALGIALGIAGALALTQFLKSLLFETPNSDPAVIAAVSALLLLSAVAACILPSVRASKPDLVSLLKSD
jgi:putative ABC transport system permease protein